jgi:hypothetical protein
MIKKLFGIALGAAIALQVDRWWGARKARFTPNALTGSLLDKVNERLEEGHRQP